MTDYKLEIEEARTLFWEKMSELVIEYELYNFDPNIKEMERDLMEAYDKSAQALTHLIETEKKKAIDDYILVTLGWMTANQENLAVHEIIATLERQSEELQGEVE